MKLLFRQFRQVLCLAVVMNLFLVCVSGCSRTVTHPANPRPEEIRIVSFLIHMFGGEYETRQSRKRND